ncbi:MAG: hypothetical protein M1274_01705 [Actinobacteria bacterium]|nr:hypothetical protein [Actinomycetota bacterium]
MRKRLGCRLVLVVAAVVCVVIGLSGQALAAPFYAGNYRLPGYGVKADITTPSSMPTVTGGVAFNFVSNYDYGQYLQVGWVQGDGMTRAPDGIYWPTVPTSYEESRCNGNYFEVQYSAQQLNYTRTYEVVHIGSGTWQGIISSTPRYSFGPFTTPTQVEALTELAVSSQPHTRAAFTSVQYKGLYSYMPFNQNYERADNPPYASFSSYSNYTCYNGM